MAARRAVCALEAPSHATGAVGVQLGGRSVLRALDVVMAAGPLLCGFGPRPHLYVVPRSMPIAGLVMVGRRRRKSGKREFDRLQARTAMPKTEGVVQGAAGQQQRKTHAPWAHEMWRPSAQRRRQCLLDVSGWVIASSPNLATGALASFSAPLEHDGRRRELGAPPPGPPGRAAAVCGRRHRGGVRHNHRRRAV